MKFTSTDAKIILVGAAVVLLVAIAADKAFFTKTTSVQAEEITTDKVTFSTRYLDGKLNYSGTVKLNNTCNKLSHDARVLESSPEQIHIDLKIVETGATSCSPEESEFSGQLKVSPKASVSVFYQGKLLKSYH